MAIESDCGGFTQVASQLKERNEKYQLLNQSKLTILYMDIEQMMK